MIDEDIAGELLLSRSEINVEWRIKFTKISKIKDAYYKSSDFNFLGSTWHIEMFLDGYTRMDGSNEDSYSFFLARKDVGPPKTVECFMKIKGLNSRKEKFLEPYTFKGVQEDDALLGYYVNESVLMRLKSSILSSDYLTISCSLKGTMSSTFPELYPHTKLKEIDVLSEDLENLLLSGTHYDVVLNVQNKEFRAHRSILAARSEVFAAMFEHETSESLTGTVDIIDCDPNSFGNFLRYLYSGKTEDISLGRVLQLYRTADKYAVLRLKSFCLDFMASHITKKNVCAVAALAQQYDEDELFATAQDYFNVHFSEVLSTESWEALLCKNWQLANRLLKSMATKIKLKD